MYIATSDSAINIVLMSNVGSDKEDGKSPIYYLSRALQGEETRYSSTEKLALAVVVAARKLSPYF